MIIKIAAAALCVWLVETSIAVKDNNNYKNAVYGYTIPYPDRNHYPSGIKYPDGNHYPGGITYPDSNHYPNATFLYSNYYAGEITNPDSNHYKGEITYPSRITYPNGNKYPLGIAYLSGMTYPYVRYNASINKDFPGNFSFSNNSFRDNNFLKRVTGVMSQYLTRLKSQNHYFENKNINIFLILYSYFKSLNTIVFIKPQEYTRTEPPQLNITAETPINASISTSSTSTPVSTLIPTSTSTKLSGVKAIDIIFKEPYPTRDPYTEASTFNIPHTNGPFDEIAPDTTFVEPYPTTDPGTETSISDITDTIRPFDKTTTETTYVLHPINHPDRRAAGDRKEQTSVKEKNHDRVIRMTVTEKEI